MQPKFKYRAIFEENYGLQEFCKKCNRKPKKIVAKAIVIQVRFRTNCKKYAKEHGYDTLLPPFGVSPCLKTTK